MMMNNTQWDLRSPEVVRSLCNKFKHTRMSKMKSAESVASSAGISEFDLHMIESGSPEKLTPVVAEKIAITLGLIQKPILEQERETVKSHLKFGKGKPSMPQKERMDRLKQGAEIRERRKKLNITIGDLEVEAGLPRRSLSQMETKGVGLFPERAAQTFAALDRLEAKRNKYNQKNKSLNFYNRDSNSNTTTPAAASQTNHPQIEIDDDHQEDEVISSQGSQSSTIPTQKRTHVDDLSPKKLSLRPRQGLVISTEHKIKCDDYELTASVSGNEFTISLANGKDLLILEGHKSEKSGILAALKAIIGVIEG